MTEYEVLTTFLDRCGIKYTESLMENKNHISLTVSEDINGQSKKVTGYNGFFTEYRFDGKNGELIEMGAWE